MSSKKMESIVNEICINLFQSSITIIKKLIRLDLQWLVSLWSCDHKETSHCKSSLIIFFMIVILDWNELIQISFMIFDFLGAHILKTSSLHQRLHSKLGTVDFPSLKKT